MTAAMDVVQLSRLQFGLTAMYHWRDEARDDV
jgi:hypothetical protein